MRKGREIVENEEAAVLPESIDILSFVMRMIPVRPRLINLFALTTSVSSFIPFHSPFLLSPLSLFIPPSPSSPPFLESPIPIPFPNHQK